MKLYQLHAFFPEAPAAHAYHEARIEASSLPVATARGLAEIMQGRHLKGRHLLTCRVTVTFLSRVATKQGELDFPREKK